jgi:hypothetical protein
LTSHQLVQHRFEERLEGGLALLLGLDFVIDNVKYVCILTPSLSQTELVQYLSKPLPFISVNSGLPQDPGEKVSTDVTLVRVGNRQPDFSSDHVLVFTPHIRAFKPQLSEMVDQPPPLDGAKSRHYTASC